MDGNAKPVHFGLPNKDGVDVEITLMSNDGRITVVMQNVIPQKHISSYLKIKVDNKGNIVK